MRSPSPRNPVSFVRHLIVLSVVTILLINSLAFTAYGRGPLHTVAPPPAPDPPANGRIVFNRGRQDLSGIFIMDGDGSNQTLVLNSGDATRPALSPDGTKIIYTTTVNIGPGTFQINVFSMNVDGSNQVNLTSGLNDARDANWSPDGSRIVFANQQSANFNIYVMNADGSNKVQLTNGPTFNMHPAWSPDGSRIAFESNRDGSYQIYVMNTDGSNQTRLTNNTTNDSEPAWSPDGSQIAFTSDREQVTGSQEIYTMNADGSNQARLTNSYYDDRTPTWSTIGDKIAFTTLRDSYAQVWVMNPDGSGQVNLGNSLPDSDANANWQKSLPAPTPQADLAATADAQPFQVEPGGALVFNNAVTNYGPSLANNVNVDVYVPPSTQLDGYTAPGGTCQTTTYPNDAGHRVVCSFGDLGVGDVRTVMVNVTITAIDGAGMQSINTVSSSTSDPVSANNIAYGELIVRAAPTPTPTPTPDACNTQNTITMLAPHCSAGLVETPTLNGGLFEKVESERGVYSFHAMMSAEAMVGDGTLQFYLPQGGTAYVGLTETEPWCGYDSVDYLFHVDANYNGYPGGSGIYLIREYNSPGTSANAGGFSNSQPPVVFRIQRQGDTVTYFANDAVYAVSNKHSTAPLHAYVLLYAPNTQVNVTQFSAVGGLKVRSNVPQMQDVTWQNPINVTVDGNSITKTSGASEGYDAGASSVQQVTSNNSFYRFKAAATDNNFLAALALDDQNASLPNSYVSLYFSYGSLYDFTNGLGGYLGPFDANSEFEVAIDNGALVYYRRDPGTGVRTPITGSGAKIKFPFLFDTSLRTTGSGVREVVFGHYPYINPCDVTPGPTPTPTPTATPTPTPTPAPVYNGRIAFVSSAPDGNIDIYTMRPDGSEQTRITNDPGNDSDPDWSPDGTKIAFASSRDDTSSLGESAIYIMNLDGTNQTKLSDVSLFTGSPAFSPDGTKIAYQKGLPNSSNGYDIHIYVMNADGTNRVELTPGTNIDGYEPTWSPDGSRIAFRSARSFANEIWMMNADGSNPVNLTNNNASNFSPAWSHDGTKIAYGSYLDGNTDIFVMNADGSNQTRVNNDPSSNEFSPAWSPDGTRIVYHSDLGVYPLSDIYVINADGTGRIQLTSNPDVGENSPAWQPLSSPLPPPPPIADVYITAYATPSYVPNGGQVTYNIVVGSFGPSPVSNITLTGQFPAGVTFVSANTAGGSCTGTPGDSTFNCTITDTINIYESRQVTVTAAATGAPYTPINTSFEVTSAYDNRSDNNSAVAQFYIASPPLPGPTPGPIDEAQLAYGKFDSNVGQWDIFRQRADAAGLVNLTNSPTTEEKYAWSPDGSRLGFLRFDFANTTASLCTVNADGSNLAVLTNVPNEYIDSFAWSPNGNRLTFNGRAWISEGPQISEVFVINADGTGRASVSGPAGYYNEPEWSPAGTRISYLRYFFDPDAPTSDIYVSNPDGTNQIAIANGASDYDSDVDWSPDGARLAFTRSDLNGIVHIFTVRGDGSDIQQLTNDPVNAQTLAPHWSPDGSKITFVSTSIDGVAHEVMNANGTGRLVVFNPPANGYPSGNAKEWSPDGTRLAFDWAIGEGVGGNTCIVNVDGTGLHCVGNELDTNIAPDWSPDGTRLAFLSRRNGEQSIDIINADGTGRVELTQGNVMSPKWRPRPLGNTPAGSNVAVTQNGATVTFSNVTTAGETTITPINPNSLTGIPGEYVINANSLAFEIHTSAVYSGPITIGFQVPGVNNPITFSALRVLHGEPPPVPNFIDRTVLSPDTPAPNFATRTIYARVTSLSPFVVLERRDPFPPVTTATVSPAANAAGWHKTNPTVTLSATDNAGGSGVQSITYSATGAQPIAQTTFNGSTKTITITTAGTTTITYRAKDVSGNIETAKTITVKLDKTVPGATTSTVNPAPNSSGYSSGLSGAPTVTLAASDPGSGASGIAGFFVSATGAHPIPANTFVSIANPAVPITHDGTTTLSYRAVDNAGNEGATGTRTVKVDATPPTTSYSVSSSGANITLTVNFSDNLSGYAAVNYSVDNGAWQTYTGPFPSNGSFSYTFNGPYHESGTYVIRYYGTDKAGNNELTKTATFTIPPQAITPTLASVIHNSNGTWTAKFGYRNDNPVTFNIAVGASNKFSPGNQNRGQTTAFQPGTVANAFTVTWDGSSLTWTIKGPDGQTRSVLAKKP